MEEKRAQITVETAPRRNGWREGQRRDKSQGGVVEGRIAGDQWREKGEREGER